MLISILIPGTYYILKDSYLKIFFKCHTEILLHKKFVNLFYKDLGYYTHDLDFFWFHFKKFPRDFASHAVFENVKKLVVPANSVLSRCDGLTTRMGLVVYWLSISIYMQKILRSISGSSVFSYFVSFYLLFFLFYIYISCTFVSL